MRLAALFLVYTYFVFKLATTLTSNMIFLVLGEIYLIVFVYELNKSVILSMSFYFQRGLPKVTKGHKWVAMGGGSSNTSLDLIVLVGECVVGGGQSKKLPLKDQ